VADVGRWMLLVDVGRPRDGRDDEWMKLAKGPEDLEMRKRNRHVRSRRRSYGGFI
jgi:hypothetical protein